MATIDLVKDSTMQTIGNKLDAINAGISALAAKTMLTSWDDVVHAARLGTADKLIAVGDSFTCTRGSGQSQQTITWDVANVTPNAVTLLCHECLMNLQFGAPQALYYTADGLAAGTYNFVYDDTNSAQFTLTNAVPAGGQITLAWQSGAVTTAKVSTYSGSSSTQAIDSDVSVSEGSQGTALTGAGLNNIERARFGSNNYEKSAIRQWLNSNAAAGSVWTAKTDFDRPPVWATTTEGFLNGLDEDFLAAVGESQVVTALNTTTDGGGSVTLNDKFFLPSSYEMYAEMVYNTAEGTQWGLYSRLGEQPITGASNACPQRVKYLTTGTARFYFTRSPHITESRVRIIKPDGAATADSAYAQLGAVPACVIK